MDLHFNIRWHIGSNERLEMPQELFGLLHLINDTGSLRKAAESQGISYRNAWGMLQKWQHNTGFPLVIMERGKGAYLSKFGIKLIWEQQRIQARLEPELCSLASEITSDLNSLLNLNRQNHLQVSASHGLAVATLRDLAQAHPDLDMDLQFHGSLDCLKQLQKGQCDLAGFHLPEKKLGEKVLSHFMPLLNPQNHLLIYALRRQQGLMTAPDNPYAIKSLEDLSKKPVRFINRQNNSGTRTTFDLILQEAGINPKNIHGYHDEEFTHLAVAAIVAGGAADCGFGIQSAAEQFKLHFIPYNWESYWFAFPKAALNTPGIQAFLAILRSMQFKDVINGLSGYQAKDTGKVFIPDQHLKTLLC